LQFSKMHFKSLIN